MKKTSQRSLLFRQNVNRTEAEWVHFLDGYRKALIEFDMKKFGDDWHTAEDIVEEIFLNIVREPRITALRPQDSFRHVLINMCMQKHKSFTKPWRRRLAERLSVALCLTMRTQDDARREIAAGLLDLVLADMADRLRSVDPDHVIYVNLFPNYAPDEVLGSTYPEHVHKYIEEVRPPLVSFDFYPVTEDGIRERWWENLEVISRESAAAGLPFWAFALSTSHKPYPIPTMASLRLQFYTDLAYGAQGLQYFTYWNPVPGTWDFHDAPIDLDGNRTPVYDLVKAMNAELQARADIFVGDKVLQVRHTGETVPPGVTPLTDLPEPLTALDTHGKGAVVSLLENGGFRYLMLVNRSLDEGFDYDIAFARTVERVGRDGKAFKVPATGTKTFHLEEGDCAIFRWK